MPLLIVLGIWIAASVALTPFLGFFLSEGSQQSADAQTADSAEASLHRGT